MIRLSVILLLFIPFQLFADKVLFEELDKEAQEAIKLGLKYLAEKQNKENGAWYGDVGYKLNTTYQVTEKNVPHVGMTSLACMAFMANGNVPGRGPYGEVVQNGLDFVLSCVQSNGFISKHDTRMYSHAFATLFLAEVYGMNHDEEVREKLKSAIDLIVRTQNDTGGWRYQPSAIDADMSITVCQVQALRAADNIGIKVSKTCIERAISYIKQSAVTMPGNKTAFTYQPFSMRETRISFALTAAGVTALHGTGDYSKENKKLIAGGLNYLQDPPFQDRHPPNNHYFYYYGHYYAVQAMFMSSEKWPEHWKKWFPKIKRELIRTQHPEGYWQDNVGKICSTAMAILILQVPYRYLPIFQH